MKKWRKKISEYQAKIVSVSNLVEACSEEDLAKNQEEIFEGRESKTFEQLRRIEKNSSTTQNVNWNGKTAASPKKKAEIFLLFSVSSTRERHLIVPYLLKH